MEINSLINLAGGGKSLLSKRIERCWNAAERVNQITGENTRFLFLEVVYNWFRYGCSDEDFLTMEFYRKNSREKKRWITSRKNNNIVRKIYPKEVVEIFDKKPLFIKKFSKYLRHASIYSGDCSIDDVKAFIDKFDSVIVKPEGGACGHGVHKISCTNPSQVNELLCEIRNGNNYMIEQIIVQNKGMSALNPDSVNTIRVETIIDQHGVPHINNMLAMLGTTSAIINNAHAGGIMCHIDKETGIIDGKGVNPEGNRIMIHPASKIVLLGYQLPNWDGIVEYAKQLALVVPEARYIGWDIVILEDGYDVIEGNVHPGVCTQACDGKGRWDFIKSKLL